MALQAPAESTARGWRAGRDATLQHIALLNRKRDHLYAAQIAAEEQVLHSIASDYAAGTLDFAGLAEAYRAYRQVAAPGFKNRWNAAIPVSAEKLLAWSQWNAPNGPAGSWEGTYPLDGGPIPPRHTDVVYVLFDAANQPCYVGSTCLFSERMTQHRRAGKEFIRWVAYPCDGREAAYLLEERLLSEHQPYLNKRKGR